MRFIVRVLLCVAAVSALHAQPAGAQEASVLEREIWRLSSALDAWELRCRAMDRGISVSAQDLDRDARRLVSALVGLESHVASGVAGAPRVIEGKLATLRSRLETAEGFARTASSAGCASPHTDTGTPTVRPRVVQPATDCHGATSIEEESVLWQFPTPTGRALTAAISGEAWLRLEAKHGGIFEAHTRGSKADTAIAVFRSCEGGALPVAVDDDMLGQQSAVGFAAEEGASLWIRVRQRVGRAVDPVFLTVRGATTGLSGVVTEATTGDALRDIRVEIRSRATGQYKAGGSTDANGAYTIQGLDAGVYVAVTRYSDEHLDELWDDRPCHEDCDVTTGDAIAVVEGEITTGIDFGLLRAGSIAGRLRDEDTGEALGNFRVNIADGDGRWVDSASTDAAGRYRVGGLSPDTHFVYTEGSAYRNEVYDDMPCLSYCEPEDGTPIQVIAEATVSGIDFDLERLGSISGTVVDALSGAPIPYAQVEIYDATGSQVRSDNSDEAGRYRVGGLGEGLYFAATDVYGGHRNEVYDDLPCPGRGSGNCTPLSGAPIAVSSGEVTGIDFALDALGMIVGRVVDDVSAGPVPSVSVEVWTATGDFAEDQYSNAGGIYVIEDLAAGTYYASTENDLGYLEELFDDLACPGAPPSGCDPTTGSPIAVVLSESTIDIDFALTLGGVVSGTLFDDFTGEAIEDQFVDLWTSRGILIRRGRTDEQGSFRIDGLPAGSYFATSSTGGDYLDELYENLACPGGAPAGCDPTTGTAIVVTTGATTSGVDLGLALRGGLSGVVTVAVSGLPLPGVGIDIWDDAGAYVATTATDATGAYIVDLPSGRFFVSTDVGGGHVDELYDDVQCPDGPSILDLCDPLLGTVVEVIGGEAAVQGINFRFGGLFADGFEAGDACKWSERPPSLCN